MTRTVSIGARPRLVAAAAAVTGVACLATFAITPDAEAAFTTGQCQGSGLNGRGASFQNAAHPVFKNSFETAFCAAQGSAPVVTYSGGGSGLGRRHMGERTSASGTGENNLDGSLSRSYPERFTGTDEPLTPTSKAQVEQGTDTAGDENQIHQIPIAAGAVAAIVNFPNNCNVESIPVANQTAPRNAGELDAAYATRVRFTNRARFTQVQWEKIWNGAQSGGDKASQWGDIFPTLTAIAGNPAGKTDQQCRDQQITRVARFDDSGTSYAFKDALNAYLPSRNWLPNFVTGPDTRNWPNATLDDGSFCNAGTPSTNTRSPVGLDGPDAGPTPSLVSACANGNNNLVPKLVATDGSVGYSDLATTIITGGDLRVTPTTDIAARDDDKYITQLPNGSGPSSYTESTKNSGGFRTDNSGGTGGSNCADTTYDNTPSTTLGDWSTVSGVNDTVGWGICTLTYALAFDDNAKAYGNNATEEGKARTVKDYLAATISTAAQNDLEAGQYSPLPAGIRSLAQGGVNSIDWNKTGTAGGGTGGGGGGGSTTPPPAAGGSTGGGSTPPVVRPSNAFSVPRTSLSSKTGTATLSIRIPGPGTLVLEPTATVSTSQRKKKAKTKKVKLGRVTRTVSKAGLVKITLKPTGSTLRALKKAGKLKVSLRVSFTPRGGTRRTTTRTITLKFTKPKAKKKAGR